MADTDVSTGERPAMTSTQKVAAMLGMIDQLKPDDAQAAAMLLAVTMLRPQVESMLPADPAELDRLLLVGANWAVRLRSDDAQGFAVVPADVGALAATPEAS